MAARGTGWGIAVCSLRWLNRDGGDAPQTVHVSVAEINWLQESRFGDGFSRALLALETGQWRGPVVSSLGFHPL